MFAWPRTWAGLVIKDKVEQMENIRVLVVDDEEEFVSTLAERLELRGFSVHTAHSGEEALAELEETSADVVVLDVLMPGMDGIDTLREMKNSWPLMEVVMLTGHATVESAIEGMKLGAYDYLMKPTQTDELVEKIQKAHARKAEHEERIRQAEIDNIVKRRGW